MSERPIDDWTEPVEPPLTGPLEAIYRRAERGRGLGLLALFAALESVGIPLPPDFLLAGLCVGAPSRTGRFVSVATVSSVVGGAVAYLTAPRVWENPAIRGFLEERLAFAGYTDQGLRSLHAEYALHGWWAALGAGLRPAAYHAHAFTAGVFSSAEPLVPFLFASVISHLIRFFLIGGTAAFFADLLRPGTARRPATTISVCVVLWIAAVWAGLPGT
jgi:membrane protein YqaA with SNARE-associated domain